MITTRAPDGANKVGVRAAGAAALTIAGPIRDKKPDMELTSASRVSKHCAVHTT